MAAEIVVVGSCALDVTVEAPRLPRLGESLVAAAVRLAPGGKASNQAIAARRLGGRPLLIVRVGDDTAYALARRVWRAERVAVHATVDRRLGTGAGVVVVDPAGDNVMLHAPGANRRLAVAQLAAARPAIARARVVSAHLNGPLATLTRAFALARAAGATTVLNASPVEPLGARLLALTDVLVVNRDEATALTGAPCVRISDAAAIAAALRRHGPGHVLVTLGGDGVVVAGPDGAHVVAALAVAPVETTGAGDAFVGGLLVGLARRHGVLDATRLASVVAGLSVRRRGTWDAYPRAADVERWRRRRGLPDVTHL